MSENSKNDVLIGTDGNDVINGLAGSEELQGGLGDDTLDGKRGNDSIFAGDGNDVIIFDAADVLIDGGAGEDTLRAVASVKGVSIDLASSTILNVEHAIGTNFHDLLTGNTGANMLNGRAGNDTLDGGAGADTLIGGAGNDTLIFDSEDNVADIKGGGGKDTLDATAQTEGVSIDLNAYKDIENIVGGTGNDTLTGGRAVNLLIGGAGDDILDGKAASDRIDGGDGNDTIIYDVADVAKRVSGGAGIDLLDASHSTRGVHINLGKYVEIENVTGGDYKDKITGNAQANNIAGGASDDTLIGQAGNDILDGGDGNDVLNGGADADTLTGGAGDDRYVFGIGSGHDVITASAENLNDIIDFGNKISLSSLEFIEDGENLTIKLNEYDSLTVEGWFNADNGPIKAFKMKDGIVGYQKGDENGNSLTGTGGKDLLYGYGGDDTITGGIGNDQLFGGIGDDVLDGGAGNDILNGGAGNDILTGGAGKDVYSFVGDFGHDIIAAGVENFRDYVVFGENSPGGDWVTSADLAFSQDGNNLVLTVSDTSSLTIEGWYDPANVNNHIQFFEFQDGVYTIGENNQFIAYSGR